MSLKTSTYIVTMEAYHWEFKFMVEAVFYRKE